MPFSLAAGARMLKRRSARTASATVLFAAFSLVTAACQMVQADATPLVETFRSAFNAGDVAGVNAVLGDEIVMTIVYGQPDDPAWQGKEAIAEVVNGSYQDNFKLEFTDYRAQGDRVTFTFGGQGDGNRALGLRPEVGTGDAAIEAANLASVRRFYEEFSAGNADVILETYAETITMHYAGEAEVVPVQAFRDDLAALKEANPDVHAVIHEMYASGDFVFTELTWEATHTGDYFGVPATGNPVVHPGLVVRRLEDGKTVESWEMWDDLVFMSGLGFTPSWEEILADAPTGQ